MRLIELKLKIIRLLVKILGLKIKILELRRKNSLKEEETIEELIRRIAKEEKVDPDLAVRVALCESNLDPKAWNSTSYTGADRGLYQINSYWHPEVSDEQALDPEFSTRFFCKAVKNGHLNWWNASRHCWERS